MEETGWLEDFVREVVLAVSAEAALVWARAADPDDRLFLLAAEGMSTRDRIALAAEPLQFASIRSLAALGPHHSIARLLGLRWVHATWLSAPEPVGALVVGSRTDRRSSPAELERLERASADVARRVAELDLRTDALETLTRRAVAAWLEGQPGFAEAPLAALRPRERTVLGLYADGLGVPEIARVLVLSPHTVRTHIKNAFRRLGVHSREEAAQLVFEHRVGRLV